MLINLSEYAVQFVDTYSPIPQSEQSKTNYYLQNQNISEHICQTWFPFFN
jgi:hypothetical protein